MPDINTTNYFQKLKEIVIIVQEKPQLIELCDMVWQIMKEIDSQRIFQIADTQDYLNLFTELKRLQGYITAGLDYGIIDSKQFDYAMQNVADMLYEFERKLIEDIDLKPKKYPFSFIDPSKNLGYEQYEVRH